MASELLAEVAKLETSRSDTYLRAFIIGAIDLERLASYLDGSQRVTFAVRLINGLQHENVTLEEFGRLSNGGKSAIRVVSVKLQRESIYASFEFRDSGVGYTVSYHISGDEREVLWASSGFEDWLASVTPWYTRLAAVDFIMFLLASFLGIFVILLFVSVTILARRDLDAPLPPSPQTARSLLTQLAVGWVWLPLFGLGALLNLIRSKVFPIAIFDVGGGSRRKQAAERLRAVFGIAFIGSILASLVATYVSRML